MLPILLSLGIIFFVALGAGRIAARFQIPRVTGYLLAGLVVGPSIADIIGVPPVVTLSQLQSLEPLNELILGLIVLVIGGNFKISKIRKIGPTLFQISAAEILLTALIVFGTTWFVTQSAVISIFLAIMAITTAPAATQMVVREYESDGPLTDLAMTLIGLNNLAAIIVFIIFAHFSLTPDEPLQEMFRQIGLPLVIGCAGGGIMALMDQRLVQKKERQIMCIAIVSATVGLCIWLDISSMFAALVSGAILVNSSPHERRVIAELAEMDYPLYVFFFVMAGAHLHLANIPHMGLIGVIYIAGRSLGKMLGCYAGTTLTKSRKNISRWLGPAMLAQAGLAIGLASTLAKKYPSEGHHIQTVILASVVIFEGIGPLLTRNSLVRSGEVTVLSLLTQKSPIGYSEGLHEVINNFASMLGIHPGHKFEKPSDILVEHIMRRNVECILNTTSFDVVLKTLGHSRYDRLPVIDTNKELQGVIQYSDISEILFEPSLRNLILAGDIATQDPFLLKPTDTLEKAMAELRIHPDHTYLLVVDANKPKELIGVVRQNDILSAQRKIM